MADLKISELAELTTPGASDILPIVAMPVVADTQHITVASLLSVVWPVGSVFTSVVATNPATLLGFGTWTSIATGRVLVGVDSGEPQIDAPEKTTGQKTATPSAHAGTSVDAHAAHQHAVADVLNHTHPVAVTDPGHSHLTQRYPTATGTSSGFTNDTSMSGTVIDNTLPVKAGATGITAVATPPRVRAVEAMRWPSLLMT